MLTTIDSATVRAKERLLQLAVDMDTVTLWELFSGTSLDPANRQRLERWGDFTLGDFIAIVIEGNNEAFRAFEFLCVIPTIPYNSLSVLYDLYCYDL